MGASDDSSIFHSFGELNLTSDVDAMGASDDADPID
jgi:hypothetical protein